MTNTAITRDGNKLLQEYKGHGFAFAVEGGTITKNAGVYRTEGEDVSLIPTKYKTALRPSA